MEPRRRARYGSFYVEAESGARAGMSATVHLARHGSHAEVGHVLSGRSEIGLSPRGRAEAAWLAERLERADLAAIHSSPRRRARETAEIVAERHGLAVEVSDALDEIDFGGWTGRSFAALADDPRWHAWNARRSGTTPPRGEAMADATARARAFVDGLDREERAILCVSHCDVIRGLVAYYLGLDPDRLLQFDCDPASLTTLALYPGGGRVVALNERPQ